MPVEVVRLKKKCGAKTREGTPCKRWAMPNGRCSKHGGKSLSGIAHPNYQHGRRTQRLPKRMLEDAMAAYSDPELASMREDIVVMDARINDLIDRVSNGESGEAWRRLREAFAEHRKAERTGDADKARYWWYEIEDLITAGVADYDAWDEVTKAMTMREKLIAAEQRRLVANGQMISADRALAIFGRLMQAIRENVHDRQALANISRVAYTLVSGPKVEIIETGTAQGGE